MRIIKLFVFLFCISIIFSCDPKKVNPTLEEISLYEITETPRNFPIDILVTNEFNETQKKAVKDALKDWKKFTNNIVTYNVTYDWIPAEKFNENIYENNYPITVWKKKWNDPSILNLQMKHSLVADGFSIGNFMIIVEVPENIEYRETYIVFKHEFGHTLGMEHIKDNYPALMNIGANQGSLSKYDMIMFCSMYKCKN